MVISYKPLWHLLVEREMNKEDLKSHINSRVSKDYYANLEILEMICLAVDCNIEKIVEIYQEDK